MKKITRNQLKKIFKKVKHFRLPEDLEEREFDKLKFLGWVDQTDDVAYTVFEYKGKLEGIRWEITKLTYRPVSPAFCEICKKHRRRDEIMLITSKPRKLDKGTDFQTKGNYVCFDLLRCSLEAKDTKGLEILYKQIIG